MKVYIVVVMEVVNDVTDSCKRFCRRVVITLFITQRYPLENSDII